MLMALTYRDFVPTNVMPCVSTGALLVLAIIVGVKLRKHGAMIVVPTLGLLLLAVGAKEFEAGLGFLSLFAGWRGFYKQTTAWQIGFLSIKLAGSGLFSYMLIVGAAPNRSSSRDS